jgi:hypothetical protein
MKILASDIERIAAHLGIAAQTLVDAVTSLWPRHPDNQNTEEKS